MSLAKSPSLRKNKKQSTIIERKRLKRRKLQWQVSKKGQVRGGKKRISPVSSTFPTLAKNGWKPITSQHVKLSRKETNNTANLPIASNHKPHKGTGKASMGIKFNSKWRRKVDPSFQHHKRKEPLVLVKVCYFFNTMCYNPY